MASDETYRVSKNTSARKDNRGASHAKMVPKLDMDAMLASHEAYVAKLRSGHEEEQQSKDAEHEEKITHLTAEKDQAILELKQTQKTAIDAAVAQAHKDRAERLSLLRSEIQKLNQDNRDIKSTLDEAVAEKKMTKEANTAAMECLQTQIADINAAHASEIAALNLVVRYQIDFRSTKRKTKTYFRHPSVTLLQASAQLSDEIKDHSLSFSFHKKQTGRELDRNKTLEAVRTPVSKVL